MKLLIAAKFLVSFRKKKTKNNRLPDRKREGVPSSSRRFSFLIAKVCVCVCVMERVRSVFLLYFPSGGLFNIPQASAHLTQLISLLSQAVSRANTSLSEIKER